MTGSALKGRRPKWQPCPGTSQQPKRVLKPSREYRLSTGGKHQLSGTGICPSCGRDVAYRERGGIARHKAATDG